MRRCLLLSAVCLLAVAGCKDALHPEILNKPKAIVGMEEGAVQVKAVDLGQLREFEAKMDARLEARMRDMRTTINTGGTTHMLILCVVIVGLTLFHPGRWWFARGVKTLAHKCNPNRWRSPRDDA